MKEFRKFTKEELESMSLAVLRAIGREIGVKAPASLKKERLIEDIMAIQAGTLRPVAPSSVGAPPKSKIDVSMYYLVPKEYQEYEEKPLEYKFCDVLEDGCFISEGVLEQSSTSYGFLRVSNYENSDGDIFISGQNIKKYNLRAGDKAFPSDAERKARRGNRERSDPAGAVRGTDL